MPDRRNANMMGKWKCNWEAVKKSIRNQRVLLMFRILLGSIFIISAIMKIPNSNEFVRVVMSYSILPYSLAELYGLVLPWAELIVGCMLVLGLFMRFASAVGALMVISFIVAGCYAVLGQSTAMNNLCGCFGEIMPLSHTHALAIDIPMLIISFSLLTKPASLLKLSLPLNSNAYIRPVSVVLVIILLTTMFAPTHSLITANTQSMADSELSMSEQEAITDDNYTGEKPVLRYFYSDRCQSCQEQKSVMSTLVEEYTEIIDFIYINTGESPEAVLKWEITIVPTIILSNKTAPDAEYERYEGYTSPEQLRTAVDGLLGTAEESTTVMPDAMEIVIAEDDAGSETDAGLSTDIEGEIDAALNNGMPVFLFFYADWCGFCQEQKPVIDELQLEYGEDITFIWVNAEEQTNALAEFEVNSFPSMFLIVEKTGDGYVFRQFSGFTGSEVLEQSFQYVMVNGDLPKDIYITDGCNDSVPETVTTEMLSPEVVSQEVLTLAQLQEELDKDPEFNEMHDTAKELGYIYPTVIQQLTYNNGTTGTIAIMSATDNSSVFLLRNSSGINDYSKIMKVDEQGIVFFNKDGGVKIDTYGSVSMWSTHHSCDFTDWSDCSFSCISRNSYAWATILHSLMSAISNCTPCAACLPLCYTTVGACVTTIPAGGVGCASLGLCLACLALASMPSGTGCIDCLGNIYDTAKNLHDLIDDCTRYCAEDPTKYPYSDRICCHHWPRTGVDCPNSEQTWLECGQYNIIRRHCIDCDYENTIARNCSPGYCREIYGVPTCVSCVSDADCDFYHNCAVGRCENYACRPEPIDCDDNDPCTNDRCDPAVGCIYTPIAGCDNPDDNYAFSTQSLDWNPSWVEGSGAEIAILNLGDAYAIRNLLDELTIPAQFIDINFNPDIVEQYPTLVIPSGGLYGLESSAAFKNKIADYVERGGTLIAFAQQHGYEYTALPGGEVNGYGWLEDQSCQHHSVGISTYHHILSGQNSEISDVNVDGYFTTYSDNATVLLSRIKNSMPAMLLYEYGEGRVIATTVFTDWAYKMGQATTDGKNLVRDMMTWASAPGDIPSFAGTDTVNIPVDVFNYHLPIPGVNYPQYAPGDLITMPISVTNSSNQTVDRIVYSVFDPEYNTGEVEKPVSITPGETQAVSFTYQTSASSAEGIYLVLFSLYAGDSLVGAGLGTGFGLGTGEYELNNYTVKYTLKNPGKIVVQEETSTLTVLPGQTEADNFIYVNPSNLGIWTLELEILDHNDTVMSDGKRLFSVSKYAENPEGWGWTNQGSEITFSITSDREYYRRGSGAVLTFHIWNSGDEDRDIIVRSGFINHTVSVPAHGYYDFLHSITVLESMLVWVYFYDQPSGSLIGTAFRGLYAYDPLTGIEATTDKYRYATGEDVDISITLRDRNDISQEVHTAVNVFDSENVTVFDQSYTVTLPPYSSDERTLTFTIPLDALSGEYTVRAQTYVESIKAGSASAYFTVRDYSVDIGFDRDEKTYGALEEMNFHFDFTNLRARPWSSTVDVSIPDLEFTDTSDLSLDAGQTGTQSYNLTLPVDITAGAHDIVLTIHSDGAIEHYQFFAPESELALAMISDNATYNAGDDVTIEVTNVGGTATVCDCSMTLHDTYWTSIFESNVQHNLVAGESEIFSYTIPGQVASGPYNLRVVCQDQNTGRAAYLPKAITVNDLDTSITSVTDEKVYHTGEDISVQTEILNSGGEIINGTLNLEISDAWENRGDLTEDWAKYYPGESGSVAYAMDLDADGNIYVTGISGGTEGYADYTTIKYDEDGNELWVALYDNPVGTNSAAQDIAIDDLGNVYVTGYTYISSSNIDCTTIKYSSNNGTELWVRGYPTGPRIHEAHLAVDNQGNVYVAGTHVNNSQNYFSYFAVKYDSDGNQLWDAKYGLPDMAQANDIIVDSAGNAIVTGYTEQSGSLRDYTTVNFASDNGTQLWVANYHQGRDIATSLAVDQQDNVYVTGTSFSYGLNYTTIKYASDNGTELWTETYRASDASSWIDAPAYIEITPWGDIYVTGPTDDYDEYFSTVKYDTVGNQLWAKEYYSAIPNGLALDSVGNAYVVARSYTDWDFIIMKYDTDGNQPWVYRIPRSQLLRVGNDIAIDEDGNIYVTGRENIPNDTFYTGKFIQNQSGPVWQDDIPVNIPASETEVITELVPGIALTGKMQLLATLYANSGSLLAQSEPYSFFVTDDDVSVTVETDKDVYKPNEAVIVSGEVRNDTGIDDTLYLQVTRDGAVIFAEQFILADGESHPFTATISSDVSFDLTATVYSITIMDTVATVIDTVTVIVPDADISIIATDVVGLAEFDVGILLQNTTEIEAALHVTLGGESWDVLLAVGQSRTLETAMSITGNTTLIVTVTGDVTKTAQKEIIMGESASILLDPDAVYRQGPVEIPFTANNTGLLDTCFEAVFAIDGQSDSRTLFVPHEQNIIDVLVFDLDPGSYTLTYTTPFEAGSVEIDVGIPEFEITLPSNLTLSMGQEATWTFRVRNVGGVEGEAQIQLTLPDWEDSATAWIMPGEEAEIDFTFTVPDDLEEKEYRALYTLNSALSEFTFYIQGAKVAVEANLDKNTYVEGEIANLTLDITNESVFDLSLYARVQLGDYNDVQPFQLTTPAGSQVLQFSVPVNFNGTKLFYGIYMDSGRALYLNSLHIHEKEDVITFYTDKQVYLTGETVSVHIETTESGNLTISAPGYDEELIINGNIDLAFAVPELRSGTYYIDYTFNGSSYSYPFDVNGYSARIIEFSLDKYSCTSGEEVTIEANIEVDGNIDGLFKMLLYDSRYNLMNEFSYPVSLTAGINIIDIDEIFTFNRTDTYALIYVFYGNLPGRPSTALASGIEYFDGTYVNTPPTLSGGTVSPVSGDTSTIYIFSIIYTDIDENAPSSIKISINNGFPEEMTVKAGQDGNYSNGETYEYGINGTLLGDGFHTYQFSANDSTDDAIGDTGIHNGPEISQSTVGGGGGEGGGGGGATDDTRITSFGSAIRESGEILEDMIVFSLDNKLSLAIPNGTFAKNRADAALYSIRVVTLGDPPEVPEYYEAIGEIYELLPNGAKFDPPIPLTIEYDIADIPEGVSEANLYIAKWDAENEEWIELESVVDTDSHTVTAFIDGFSIYTVMASTQPASFLLTDLTINPGTVELGDNANISVYIINTGNLTGTHEVKLIVNNETVKIQEVTIDGGADEVVSFILSPEAAGIYNISIGGLTGQCAVIAPSPLPTPAAVESSPTPAPASFTFSNLSVSPSTANPGEQVFISTVITNTGGCEGICTVVLEVNGTEEDRKEVTLEAGTSETVTFSIAKDTQGSYVVNIDDKTGEFNVFVPTPSDVPPETTPEPEAVVSWWLIGGIIAGTLAIGLLVYFIVYRKLRASRTG